MAPQLLEANHPLSSVRNEYNAVTVEGAFAEKQTFIGKGAGSYPTGSAVLSDISALTYDYRYEYKKSLQENGLTFSNDAQVEVLVSFSAGQVGHTDFIKVTDGYRNGQTEYIRGLVSFEKISEWFALEGVSVLLAPEAVIQPLAKKALLNA